MDDSLGSGEPGHLRSSAPLAPDGKVTVGGAAGRGDEEEQEAARAEWRGAGRPATEPLPFPDIYGGDPQMWEAHFRGIHRAYQILGKEEDLAIRVLTEDFTLPFPYTWPPGPDTTRETLFYDPQDRTDYDFLLRPGAQPPALLRPLHATAQAFIRKRQLEQLALGNVGAPGAGPGPEAAAPEPESREESDYCGPETSEEEEGWETDDPQQD
ncbi:uncharacterized protein LOC114811045 [Ornithorhynchus anatinus]|uniref:uncharacterized protein LOC114811045 n=1 Tax=Ornithorhynchus anatinus TaxID=9258 RepID=UPI0010A93799|nr:uncharacterized protein LOC114811045 [Ornithorhynchus anatinus]